MSKPNNFATTKPTVILLVMPDTEPKVLKDSDENIMVFTNLKKAQKHVANRIEGEFHPFIEYANTRRWRPRRNAQPPLFEVQRVLAPKLPPNKIGYARWLRNGRC